MTTGNQESNREMEELLPFYVAGTLDATETRRVEDFLSENPRAQKEVEILRSVKQQIKDTSFGESPGELGFKRLERRIGQEKQSGLNRETAASNDNVEAWWRPVGIAASFAAAFFAFIAIQNISVDPDGGQYQTASGPVVVQGPVIQVRFQPDVSEQAMRTLLVENKLRIVSGPGSAGVYYLEYQGENAGAEAIEALIETLQANTGVVSFAAED